MQNPFGFDLNILQEKVKELEASMEKLVVTGSSGAGMVEVTVNGKNRVVGVSISNQVYEIGDKSTMEVLVAAAVNDAMQKLDEKKLSQTQDLGQLFGGFQQWTL